MADNSFGTLFRFTTFGESHGPAIGCVVDGVPPRLPLDESDIQPFLDRRKPGTSRFVTQRREDDSVRILSGVFEGKTTGTPIALLIENTDQRSKDYSNIAQQYRPGHADYTYDAKYGIRDYRGWQVICPRNSQPCSGRCHCSPYSVKHLPDLVIRGAVVQIGDHAVNRDNWNWIQHRITRFFVRMLILFLSGRVFWMKRENRALRQVRLLKLSPMVCLLGLGGPIYNKLDAQLAAAMMSINAVKGVEIGDGFAAASIPGDEAGDSMRVDAHGNPSLPAITLAVY